MIHGKGSEADAVDKGAGGDGQSPSLMVSPRPRDDRPPPGDLGPRTGALGRRQPNGAIVHLRGGGDDEWGGYMGRFGGKGMGKVWKLIRIEIE